MSVIEKRYSVRAFKSTDVEDDKVKQILDAARLAPTAVNRQPIQFIVIHTRGRKEELRRIYRAEWFSDAPVVICACLVTSQGWKRMDGKNYSEVDITIAMDHLILAATDLGLGTCWIGAFNPSAAKEILGIPSGVEPVAFTPLGYAADTPLVKKRKSLDELVRYEHW